MNKYQFALEGIKNESYTIEKDCYSCFAGAEIEVFDEDNLDIKVIQELVDKATPKKPLLLAENGFAPEVTSHVCCPNCKQPIINVWNRREYKPIYCHYCGQKIEWSDSGE